MQEVELDKIVPADYNPRKLSDEAFELLKESISTLGILKPILVNKENMVILAGHQRTRAMRELGIKKSPCYFISGMNKCDEVRFNQTHNLAEYEINGDAPIVYITSKLQLGNNRVSHKDMEIKKRGNLPLYLGRIDQMLVRYGEFCAPVAIQETGEVIVSAGYASAVKLRRKDIDIIAIPQGKKNDVLRYFSQTYGVFCYDGIQRATYNQTYAQMMRLRGTSLHNNNESILYREHITPYLHSQPNKGKNLRILDFGAGQYDYAMLFERKGYDIHYVDPYHRNSSSEITVGENKRRFIHICEDLKEKGQYDVVICDSVLNSIDTKEAEWAVINTCFALTRYGGQIFMAGRLRDMGQHNDICKTRTKQISGTKIYWLDEDGFTGIYRKGNWYFQKLHTQEEVERIGRHLGTSPKCAFISSGLWKLQVTKDVVHDEDELIKALRFEFDMMLPKGIKYNLAEEIEYAYRNRKMS